MSTGYQSAFDGVSIVTDAGQRLKLSSSNYRGGGKDGEVFQIDDEHAVKMYMQNPIEAQLHDKLKTLRADKEKYHQLIVVPVEMVRKAGQSPDQAAGFLMRYLPDAKPLTLLQWDASITPDKEASFDQMIADMLYDISEAIENLHGNRVFVGDLKPQNILVCNLKPYLVDFDSCALPNYPGNSFTIEYVDPRLRDGVPNARGPYEFDARSDWWSLAVIAFELFMGASPWAGIHPKYRGDPLVFRSFNYSVVGLDSNVRPYKFMRDASWLARKPKLKSYFQGIFSPEKARRVPIVEALDAYFPRTRTAHPSAQVQSLVESLARNNTLTLSQKEQELRKELLEVKLAMLSPQEREFVRLVAEDIGKTALREEMRREEARVHLLDMMFGAAPRPAGAK